MRIGILLLLATTVLLGRGSCQLEEPDRADTPRLVVLIGIDQFRAGYLERYDTVFTEGFRRLLDEGRWYKRAIVDHAPTLSYPGHTTLATGTHPRTHGINTNAWLETLPDGTQTRSFVMIDTMSAIVDHPELTGLSPRNLRVSGLADWIRAAHPDAQAVALSTGSGLAMVYGGRALDDEARNHAYWLSSSTGTFITTTYFRTTYPDWVANFNRDAMPRSRANRVWENTTSEVHRRLARADTAHYEGDGTYTAFPHRFDDRRNAEDASDPAAYNRWFWNGPFADEALFALAREAVQGLSLGRRQATDLLAIAIKSVDRNGHDYGPRSQEQLDILVRLDRQLGALFSFLDETVGAGNYVVAVSADHGAPNVVEYELEQGRPGRRVSEQDIQDVLDGIDRFVTSYDGPEADLPERIARELERAAFIARAMTPRELADTTSADDILRAYRNTYVPGRRTPFPLWTSEILGGHIGETHPANWGIAVEFTENAQLWTARSAHGTSYVYDREVPILFMGPGVRPGVAIEPARTVDVAPTLADLANMDYPQTVEGVVLNVR